MKTTRERWLLDLANELNKTIFDNRMPEFRITCGFPSKGGTAQAKKVIGQCWYPEASNDDTTEIIMTICEDDPMIISATVAHEMVHAIACAESDHRGHGKPFKDLALQIGLTGKMTATVASETFKQAVQPILDTLGKYPHSKLDATQSPTKKQTTRMIKCECEQCGYTIRTSRKWIELGAPYCALHKDTQMVMR